MTSPAELRADALKVLRTAQRQMNSAPWILSLEKQSPEVRTDAAERLLDVQRMKLRLENEELSEIRDRLLENEAALVSGQAKLVGALQNLGQVAKVLDAVRGFLGTIERVVAGGSTSLGPR